MEAVGMTSGVRIRERLIDWVELSDRKGRNEEGAEV